MTLLLVVFVIAMVLTLRNPTGRLIAKEAGSRLLMGVIVIGILITLMILLGHDPRL